MTINMAMSLFATAILTLTTERVMRVFFEKKRTPLPVIALSYLFLWAALSLQFWIESTTLFVLLYMLALIIISFNYESEMIQRMSAVAGSYYVMFAITTGIFHVLAYILPHDLSINFVDVAFVTATLISYLMVLLIFPHFKNIRKTTVKMQKIWLPFFLIIAAHPFAPIFHQLNTAVGVAIDRLTISFGIAFMIFFLYNKLSKAFEENIKSALHSQEKEYYYTQCHLMQESVEQVKAVRHDMKLHLATAKKYVASNRVNEAADYLDSLLSSVEESEIYSDTGNIAFDSIINFKLNEAKADNVKPDITVHIPPVLNIEIADVVTILGNLLDNALDAVAKTDDKRIKLDIYFDKGGLFINISNTFDGEVKYVEGQAGDKNGIVSRKTEKGHGYGLKNIRKSVEKYNGDMDIKYEGNIFSVEILVYVQDKQG